MPDTNPFGKLTILETVNRGLMDVIQVARPVLLLVILPSLLAGFYQFAVFDGIDKDTGIATYILIFTPEYLIAAPFYMAMLYLISRGRRQPATSPRDAVFAGIALFPPFVLTTLLLLLLIAAAGLLLGLLIQVQDGQLVIGLGGLLAILLLYLLLLALSFYPLFILFEQRTGIAALKASLGLFRSHWRRILAVLFFPVMLILLLQNLWLQLLNATIGTEATSPGLALTLLGQMYSWVVLAVFEGVRLSLFQDLQARAAPA